MKFTLIQYADISTGEIAEPGTPADEWAKQLELLSSGPYTFADYEDGCFMYIPTMTEDKEMVQDLIDHGFTHRMTNIFLEAKAQGIPYLRFDPAGGKIEE